MRRLLNTTWKKQEPPRKGGRKGTGNCYSIHYPSRRWRVGEVVSVLCLLVTFLSYFQLPLNRYEVEECIWTRVCDRTFDFRLNAVAGWQISDCEQTKDTLTWSRVFNFIVSLQYNYDPSNVWKYFKCNSAAESLPHCLLA